MAKADVTELTFRLNQDGKETQSFTDAAKAGEAWFKADNSLKSSMILIEPGGGGRFYATTGSSNGVVFKELPFDSTPGGIEFKQAYRQASELSKAELSNPAKTEATQAMDIKPAPNDAKENQQEAARGPAYGVMQIDDKPATSLRYERSEKDGDVSYNVSFHMGTKSVARVKELSADSLADVVGEKNAKTILESEELKGSLKGESLQNEYGLSPDESLRRSVDKETPSNEHGADIELDADDEINKIEHVPELEKVNMEEALARAAANRQRDRDRLQLDQDSLGQRAESKRIDVENLSEKAEEQDSANTLGERTGATTDYDGQQSTEREKNRQVELMEQVHNQFRVSGPRFHFKDQPGKLAFKDKGQKIVSASNDERVAKAMATMAEAKGWKTIKVSGHPDFQKEVWMEASLRGLEVRGYKPSEQDLKLLEARRDRTLGNSIEREPDREREEPRKRRDSAQENTRREATNTAPERTTAEARPQAATPAEKGVRAYSGTLIEHGAAKFNHDPEEKMSYFVKLNTDKGEETVWGVDLKRAVAAEKAKPGDAINLEYKGSKIVEVEKLTRNEKGHITGKEIIETPRNEWKVDKSDKHKVVDAVAEKFLNDNVKDPAQREQLRAALSERTNQRAQQGKIPDVKVYDKDAKAQQPERQGPAVEINTERTR